MLNDRCMADELRTQVPNRWRLWVWLGLPVVSAIAAGSAILLPSLRKEGITLWNLWVTVGLLMSLRLSGGAREILARIPLLERMQFSKLWAVQICLCSGILCVAGGMLWLRLAAPPRLSPAGGTVIALVVGGLGVTFFAAAWLHVLCRRILRPPTREEA